MPYERPGERHYATATKAVAHGLPVVEGGVVGVAIKQIAPPAGTGLTDPLNTTIQIGEKFVIDVKGIVEVPNTGPGMAAAVKGTPVYIVAADNTLTTTGPAGGKFGRVTELPGERKTPTGYCRVNMDMRDSF
jgi:hypothetical protein